MSPKSPKLRLYAQVARIAKALASPTRLELVEILAQGGRSVDALAKVVGSPIANVSHHLHVLRDAGLVIAQKQGLFVRYSLPDPAVFDLHRKLAEVGRQRLSEIDSIVRRYFEGRDRLEPVDRAELLRRVRDGSVIVLDVRPPEEYAAGHVPGAVSLPLESLEAGLDQLPKGKLVVAYCRGPYCVMAFEAVRLLCEHGRDARRLEEGFPEWRAEGMPVAMGSPTGRPPRRVGCERGRPNPSIGSGARRVSRSATRAHSPARSPR